MYSKKIESYKKKLKLSKLQREIIIGKLLGDGCLEARRNGETYRLKVEHSVKQREYVNWLYELFKDWVLTSPKEKLSRSKHNYGFQTVSHSSLRFYGQQFYGQDGVKKVPIQIRKWLTPRALAIWFMDDGSAKDKKRKAQIINTQGFTVKDLRILQSALEDNYGIDTLLKKERDRKVIYIRAESLQRFVDLIKPYVIPSMRYKLPG